MQKPRDKGDYGLTPTDEEKRRLTGQDQGGPASLNDHQQQNGSPDEEDNESDRGEPNEEQQDAADRINTPHQDGGK